MGVKLCETWSLTLREERRLRVFEELGVEERRIFGPKIDEVTGEWRKLHNEEPNNLCCSLNIIRVNRSRRMKWTGYVAHMGGEERCIQCFGGETGGKETTWKTKHKWEDNINPYPANVETRVRS